MKFLAVYSGVAGLAIFGQLTNASTIILTVATGAISTGVTKYVAEFGGRARQQLRIIALALRITLICSFCTGMFLALFSAPLGYLLFETHDYDAVLQVFGLTVVFYAVNTLIMSIVNGLKLYKTYVLINIVSSLTMALATVIMVYYWGIWGALLAYVTTQSAILIITLSILNKKWMRLRMLSYTWDSELIMKLLAFSVSTLAGTLLLPLAQIGVRGVISHEISIEAAGMWEGLTRISAVYLTVITTSIQIYYLPRLSEIKSKPELMDEIKKTYKLVMPPLVIVTIIIFLTRDIIISILFTEKFVAMRDLFAAQLFGDTLKIASWLIAFVMPAKGLIKQLLITEILFNGTYVVLTYWFVESWGFQGIPWGYVLNYFLYGITVFLIFRRYVNTK